MGRLEKIRLVNPVLTQIAFDYKFQEFAGFSLFPVVNVDQASGKIPIFGKEAFKIIDTKRALRAVAKRVDDSVNTTDYAITEDALERGIDDREVKAAADIVNQKLMLGASRVKRLMNQIGLGVEKSQADMAVNAGNYPTGNKILLSGTSQWSDYTNSKPVSDIATAKEAIRSKIGLEPNTLFLSASVYNKLRNHPELKAVIQYSQKGILTSDLIAEIFDVKNVVIGRSVYTADGDTFIDIWGKNAIMAYVPENSISTDEPSYGYSLRQNIYPIVDEYREEKSTSDIVRVRDGLTPKLLGAVAGYLIAGAIA